MVPFRAKAVIQRIVRTIKTEPLSGFPILRLVSKCYKVQHQPEKRFLIIATKHVGIGEGKIDAER